MKLSTVYVAGIGIAGLAVAFLLFKKGAAKAAGQQVAGAVGDAAAGGVIGIGSWFGIPETNAAKCRAAIDAGDRWEASKYCPAKDFSTAVFNSQAAIEDARGKFRTSEIFIQNYPVGAPTNSIDRVYTPDGVDYAQYDALGNRIY